MTYSSATRGIEVATEAIPVETPISQQDKDKLVTYKGKVVDKDGKPVASVKELQKEESLQIRLADGRVETRILKIEGLEPGSGELEEETYGGN